MAIDTAVAVAVAAADWSRVVDVVVDSAAVGAVELGWVGRADVAAIDGSAGAADVASAHDVGGESKRCAADIAVADVVGAEGKGCANDTAAAVDDAAAAPKNVAVDTAAAAVADVDAAVDVDAADAAADGGRSSRHCQA